MAMASVEGVSEFQSIDFLRRLPLFHGVSEITLNLFLEKLRIKKCPKRNILFMQGDEANYFYIVIEGWVKLFRETLDGNEAVIDILTNGHMFGTSALFEDRLYPYGAEAVEEVKLMALPLSLLEEMIHSDKTLALNMLSSVSRRNRQQSKEIEHLAMQTAPQRLGCFLLRLCPANATGKITLRLPYDKTLVASRLGMKPETFSRSLKKLGNEVDLTVDGATIHIHNIDDMAHYTCNACSQSFPCDELAS